MAKSVGVRVTEREAKLLNYISCVAHNLIFDFSSRFDKRQDYLPVEKLAAEVQKSIILDGVKFIKRRA